MARRSRKGYFVEGQFVAAGSAADKDFQESLRGGDRPSRGARKAESSRLQIVGEQLVDLPDDRLAGLALPESLLDALLEARRITDFEAGRRHRQYLGRLMRRLEPELLEAIAEALRVQRSQSAQAARRLHLAEGWRAALIGHDGALDVWLRAFPETDVQRLRSLVRQARLEAPEPAAGGQRRHGRAYREIFALVRGFLDGVPPGAAPPVPPPLSS
jgi:ribosome-associated protein